MMAAVAAPPDDADATAASKERGGFGAYWSTLGLAQADLATSATVRPESQAPGLSIRTLPQLSIRLPGDAPAAPTTEPVGDIHVVGLLGEGGMGRVLLAEQRSLRREVALKTLKDAAVTPEHVDSLLREGVLTGHLEHPNITPVHQLGLDAQGRPVLVMKRISGVAWSTLIRDDAHEAWTRLPALPEDHLRAHVEILMQVANALALAHSRGIIHRDLKPDNVMIGEFGEVYLVDWGIALELAHAAEGRRRLVGTPHYVAPEMLDGSIPLGTWTDVYLLGATLHAILTGGPRHRGDDLHAVLASAWDSAPGVYGDEVPQELADLCNRATAREPQLRPGSAIAFRAALQDYLAHRGSLALARSADERLDRLVALRRAASPDRGETVRLAAECRFGHLQALREWPANPVARRGLARVLGQLVELEIAAENLADARSWLEELEPAPPELVAALGALEARLAERAANAARLRELEREQDLSLASKERSSIAILMMISAVGISAFAIYQRTQAIAVTPRSTIWFGAMVLAVVIGGVFVRRKALFTNRVNRGLVATFVGGVALLVLNRALAVAAGQGLADILRTDLMVIGGISATAGFLVAPLWLGGAVTALAGATLITFVPEAYAEPVFSLSALILIGFLGFGWRQKR
jgi:hypothetical protein